MTFWKKKQIELTEEKENERMAKVLLAIAVIFYLWLILR